MATECVCVCVCVCVWVWVWVWVCVCVCVCVFFVLDFSQSVQLQLCRRLQNGVWYLVFIYMHLHGRDEINTPYMKHLQTKCFIQTFTKCSTTGSGIFPVMDALQRITPCCSRCFTLIPQVNTPLLPPRTTNGAKVEC